MTDDEQSEQDNPDVIEKVEEVEKGYRLSLKSKRGTGTNDRDEVHLESFSEEYPSEKERMDLASDVTQMINYLRQNQPVVEE